MLSYSCLEVITRQEQVCNFRKQCDKGLWIKAVCLSGHQIKSNNDRAVHACTLYVEVKCII